MWTFSSVWLIAACGSSGTLDADEFSLFMTEFNQHLTTEEVKERFNDLIPPDRHGKQSEKCPDS